jgi:ribonuclease Y
LISAFSPIRRHLAKRTLEKLIEDGRIHPTRIEECVDQAKNDLAGEIMKAGEEALYEMGITGIDPKLTKILGRLRYRTSYGQNVLRHSIEVGVLAGLIAEQLGANVAMCRKAGLFHDIGKALDHDIQGTHPEIGRDIGRRFNFNDDLADAAFCHHDDRPPTIEAVIVKVADSISGGRPGARKDSYEQYIQRLEELEDLAKQFEGVTKAYAIQAGREVRIFVEPQIVTDMGAFEMARDIAKKIEAELRYPGEIKVNIIRETRVIEYAR